MKLFALLFLFVALNCNSQITFDKRIKLSNPLFGGQVLELTDGYLISGYSKNSSDHFDIVLVKLNKDGSEVWTKYLGEPNEDEQPNFMSKFKNEGFLIAATESYTAVVYLINIEGDTIWKSLLETNVKTEFAKSAVQLNDSTIICVAGNASGSVIYNLDSSGKLKKAVYLDSITVSEVCKYDEKQFALVGTLKVKDYNTDIYYAIMDQDLTKKVEKKYGGNGHDNGYSIAMDKNKDLYILGDYDYQIIDYTDGMVTLKINFQGDTIWKHTMDWIHLPKHIEVDSNLNSYYSTQVYYENELHNVVSTQFGIIKIDSVGKFQWSKHYNGESVNGNSFATTEDLGFIMAGYEAGDLKVLKLDRNGMFKSNSPNFKEVYDFAVGDIFLYQISDIDCGTGGPKCVENTYYEKFEIIEKSIHGDTLSYTCKDLIKGGTYSKTYVDSATHILNNYENDIVLYDPETGPYFLRVQVKNEPIVKKIFGGQGNMFSYNNGVCDTNAVITDPEYHLIYGKGLGLVEEMFSFFEISRFKKLIAYREGNDTIGNLNTRLIVKDDMQIQYTNPFTDKIIVQFQNSSNVATIDIININGSLMKKLNVNSSYVEIPAGYLKRGVYFMKMYSKNSMVTKKLIKN